MSDRLKNLSSEQQQKVLELLKNKLSVGQVGKIEKRKTNRAPLSYSQEGMWVINQLDENDATYNTPYLFHVEGVVNIPALKASLQEIVRRHHVLRTCFSIEDGIPRQIVMKDYTLDVPVIDFQSSTLEDKKSTDNSIFSAEQKSHSDDLENLLRDFNEGPFDFNNGPLVRVMLIRCSEHMHMLCINIHHLAFDASSTVIFEYELLTLYDAFAKGKASPLAELPIQYADYALWQRQSLDGDRRSESLSYWQKQLADLPPLLQLPTDYSRPKAQSHKGALEIATFPKDLMEGLSALGQRENTTLFMLLLSAAFVFIFRHSGQKDIPIGSVISDRSRKELEGVIGYFINTAVLRGKLSPTQSYLDLLKNVRKMTLQAFNYPEVPFDELFKVLKPERSLSYSPWFQMMLILLPKDNQVLSMQEQQAEDYRSNIDVGENSSLKIDPQFSEHVVSKFDMTWSLKQEGDELGITVEYSTDLFKRETIVRWIASYQKLLQSIIENPDQSILDFSIIDEMTYKKLIIDWNSQPQKYPQIQNIHQLFERQVQLSPTAIAVQHEDKKMSYEELNKKANQLAHYLIEKNTLPEERIGICLKKSPDLLVAVIATLKAGCTYVPLNPEFPKDRIDFIIKDTNIKYVISTELLVLSDIFVNLLNWDLLQVEITNFSIDNPSLSVAPRQLAYIIYTSGSTDKPKGVMICHENLVSAYYGWESAYELSDGIKSHLQMADFSFDVFSGDYIRALCSGGRLVLCSKETLLEPISLYNLIESEKIDIAEFVPAVLRLLISYLKQNNLSLEHIQLLICGSDVWSATEYRQFKALCHPGVRLINSYGLTEATIDSLYYEDKDQKDSAQLSLPVGKPYPNTQAYILDNKLNLIPIGVTGELCIAGNGVGLGYLGRPDLTEEKFVFDPFSNNPDQRLYRTGDWARYRSDGQVELIERMDLQVKVRGYRIELGEIESVLNNHPDINETVVTVRQEVENDKYLAAYMVVSEGFPADNVHKIFREYLKASLPDYMVPQAFVVLDKFPLTPNGKINRKDLPKPDASSLYSNSYKAPTTKVEKQLAVIWSDVLNVDKVSVNDEFFDLGGHSLLAVKLVSKVQSRMDVKLSLQELFKASTIDEMAKLIDVKESDTINSNDAFDLRQEVVLGQDIVPEGLRYIPNLLVKNILLTGATGFLGIHLLYELIETTAATIYCLIRANDPLEAKKRLIDVIELYEINNFTTDNNPRIQLITGDLALPQFGLSDNVFDSLAEKIDVIYHNGAALNLIYPYYALKTINVEGTRTILELACKHHIKALHYISTPNVLDPNYPPAELFDVPYHNSLEMGYAQSKWVAEQLINIASTRGLPASIYRPYRISGHTQTGAWNTQDFFCNQLKGVLDFGKVVKDEFFDNLVPVDYVSQAIVYIANKTEPFGKAFHLSNPRKMPYLLTFQFFKQKGFALEFLEYKDWRTALDSYLQYNQDSLLMPYSHGFYPTVEESEAMTEEDERQISMSLSFSENSLSADLCYVDQQTLEHLSSSGLSCPIITFTLWEKYYEYFKRTGFLKCT